jgi:nucleotide-binding universal stress UspA family protein
MATATLRDAGVSARALDVLLSEGVEGWGAAERILELARARRCDTVVVGRESMSWFRDLMGGNLAAELVRRGKGYTIWVVE